MFVSTGLCNSSGPRRTSLPRRELPCASCPPQLHKAAQKTRTMPAYAELQRGHRLSGHGRAVRSVQRFSSLLTLRQSNESGKSVVGNARAVEVV